MEANDRVSSIVLLIISILSCLGASPLRIGSLNDPGPGFSPFVLGVGIGVLSLLLLVKTKLKKKTAKEERALWFRTTGQKKIVFILLSLVLYGLLLEKLGYILTTFLLYIFFLKMVEPQRWYIAVGVAFLTSVATFVLFELCLNVPLPRGFLFP
jgi:putative tricarboxylic transport membrane protein